MVLVCQVDRALYHQLLHHKERTADGTSPFYLFQLGLNVVPITPQKPVKRAYERCHKKVRKWLDEQYPAIEQRALKEGAEIHWGDETGLHSEDQIGRGYSLKGKTPIREHRGKKKSSI